MKEYAEKVKNNIEELFKTNKQSKNIRAAFDKHGISSGYLQSLVNNPSLLDEEDIRVIALIGDQLSCINGLESLKIENNFNEQEISDIRQYFMPKEDTEDEISFPYVIEDVIMVSEGCYSFSLSYQFLSRLYDNQKLNYNYDVQRQPKYVKRQDEIIKTPSINKKSVVEISEHIIKQTLVPTTLAINAALGSSKSGNEVIYDSKNKTLTITEGTRLDILDGMHRTLGASKAYSQNRNLDAKFNGNIFNYDTKQAQRFQSQQAKHNPIPKGRIEELEASRYADVVVKQLRMDSEIKDAITSRDKFSQSAKELVSYGVLANAIDKEFEFKNKFEAVNKAKYLSDYFMYLFGYFGEYALNNKNLLFYNKMFAGHIRLAKKMEENNISLDKLERLNAETFDRNSSEITSCGILINGNISSKPEKAIEKFIDEIIFSQIQLLISNKK